MKRKRFVALFDIKLPKETEQVQQDIKKLAEELKTKCMEKHDCSICLIQSVCPMINVDIGQCMFGTTETEDEEQIQEIVDRTKEIFDPSIIVVVDSKEDICFIYKAEENLIELKKTKLQKLLESYEKTMNTYPFLGTVKDMRK